MDEILEQLAREIAARDAALYLEEFGEPISSATLADVIQTSLFKAWVVACEEREVVDKEFRKFSVSYYPCFADAYLKTIYGDESDIRVTGMDYSDDVNN
jgi:hypothetical protein